MVDKKEVLFFWLSWINLIGMILFVTIQILQMMNIIYIISDDIIVMMAYTFMIIGGVMFVLKQKRPSNVKKFEGE